MRYLTTTFLIAALAAVLAGCGGGGDSGSVPSDAVAEVNGQTITQEQFNALLDQAKKSYVSQKRKFPKAGTTEYDDAEEPGRLLPRPARGVQAGGRQARRHGQRRRRRQAPQADQEAVLRRQRVALQEAAQAAGPDRRAGARRHQGPAHPGEDLQEGDERHEGVATPTSRSTTTRTRRNTARPSSETSRTSSSSRRRRPTSSISGSRRAKTSRSSPRSTRRIRARRPRAAS